MKTVIALLMTLTLLNAAGLRVLVSGFEPFGGYAHNPTERMVEALRRDGLLPEGVTLEAVTVPVTYFESWEVLRGYIERFRPDVVLAFGFAPSSHAVRIETLAHNHDAGYADNANRTHRGKIVTDGVANYPSGLPVDDLIASLTRQGFSVQTSENAGGYLCNHLFYHLMHYTTHHPMRAGFIHIPDLAPEGKHGSVMLVQQIVESLKD